MISNKEGMSLVKLCLWVGVAVIALVAPLTMCSTASSVANKGWDRYEWFYDVNASFEASKLNIASHKELLNTTDPEEKRNVQIELSGMKQLCFSLAEKYNAESKKINRALFKSNNLPYEVSTQECLK